jgi:hypothetical protein
VGENAPPPSASSASNASRGTWPRTDQAYPADANHDSLTLSRTGPTTTLYPCAAWPHHRVRAYWLEPRIA